LPPAHRPTGAPAHLPTCPPARLPTCPPAHQLDFHIVVIMRIKSAKVLTFGWAGLQVHWLVDRQAGTWTMQQKDRHAVRLAGRLGYRQAFRKEGMQTDR
jgi:hypothetical protein